MSAFPLQGWLADCSRAEVPPLCSHRSVLWQFSEGGREGERERERKKADVGLVFGAL